jgi:hypothetical protein
MVIGRKLKILIWITIGVTVVALALPLVGSKDSLVPLLVGLLDVAAAVTIPVVLGRKQKSYMSAWLAVYVIAYSFLSWHGRYIDANLGGSDNRSIWYPAYCGEAFRSPVGRQKSTFRPLGWFFLPLVVIDRPFVHRTHFDAF